VTWQVTSGSAGTTTVVWRPVSSWWRPGPSRTLTGPVTDASFSDSVNIGVPTIGTVIEVRSRVTNATGKCYSATSNVTVVDTPAECATEITSIPTTVAPGDDVPVTFEATSSTRGWAAILWRVQGSYWHDGGTTGFPGPILNQSFSRTVDVGSQSAGTVLEFRSRVINATTRCYSPISQVTVQAPGPACEVEITSAPGSVAQGDPIPVQWRASSSTPGWTAILWRPRGSYWRDGGMFSFSSAIVDQAYSRDVNIGVPGVGTVIELRARIINASQKCYSDVEETTVDMPGGQGESAPSSAGVQGTAGLAIAGVEAGADGVSVVVQVTAPSGLASTVAVQWLSSDGGQVARTAAQTGTGSYRAVFSLPASARQAQAVGVIGGVPAQSAAAAIGDG
jgi:hypothetical protein